MKSCCLILCLAMASKTVSQATADSMVNPADRALLAQVPAGNYTMGSDSAELDAIWMRFGWTKKELPYTRNEQPARLVYVPAFRMYKTLVTVAQYRLYCRVTGKKMPAKPRYGWADDHPIINISWFDAAAYCQWAGGRLPREAEWEWAARGGHTRRTVFVWGDSLPAKPVANLADESFLASGYYDSPGFHAFRSYNDGYATASPVLAFPPNGYGLYDMAGNVLEWCADDYDTAHTRRVLRGGAFDTTPTVTRITRRLGNYPHIRNEEKGCRCVIAP